MSFPWGGERGGMTNLDHASVAAARALRVRLLNRAGTDVAVTAKPAQRSSFTATTERLRRAGGLFTEIRSGEHRALLFLHGALVDRLVGYLLGGPPSDRSGRMATSIDAALVKPVALDVAACLFAGVSATEPTISALSPSAPSFQPGVPSVTIEFGIGPLDAPWGEFTVALPTTLVRLLSSPAEGSDAQQGGMDRVLPLPVEAIAELARVKIGLATVRAMKPGTVLPLGPRADVVVMVAGKPTLLGEAGAHDGRRSVRVKGRC
jgi:flagellar motor switch protein FliM